MKTKLIIILGANSLHSDNKYIQKIIATIYKNIFNFVPIKNYNLHNPWLTKFNKNKFEIIDVKWSGKPFPNQIRKTRKKVQEILENNINSNIIFLTESIGTEIAISAIEKSQNKNVKKIIAICPVNKPRKIQNYSIISIKSNHDTFAKFSNKILWPFQILRNMSGNIETIILKNIRHDQFIPEQKINNNKTLLNLIKEKIKD